jgi:hypothetical protein
MSKQLEIDVPIERHAGDRYTEAEIEYRTIDKSLYAPVFLCYNGDTKQYFVSKFTSRHGISQYKLIKIIQ